MSTAKKNPMPTTTPYPTPTGRGVKEDVMLAQLFQQCHYWLIVRSVRWNLITEILRVADEQIIL